MANERRHSVRLKLEGQGLDIGRSVNEYVVQKDGHIFGRLFVRGGSIGWTPYDRNYAFTLTWDAVDAFFKAKGTWEGPDPREQGKTRIYGSRAGEPRKRVNRPKAEPVKADELKARVRRERKAKREAALSEKLVQTSDRPELETTGQSQFIRVTDD